MFESAPQAVRQPLFKVVEVLRKMDDPGKVFDIIESWMKYKEISVAFGEDYEPLNFLVGFARRDFSVAEKLFWRLVIPEMVSEGMLSPQAKAKAARRRYQRVYMRKRRQEEKVRQPQPVKASGEYDELEAMLAAMPDDDTTEAGLLPGNV